MLLSGGIGSGKSSVGQLLEARGALLIQADIMGHLVLEPGAEAFDSVAARWPSVVRHGRIDRRELGRTVFAEPDQLAELESYTHPAIRDRIYERLQDAVEATVVVEVPLQGDFLGPGWLQVVVDAPVEVRRDRLIKRGMLPDDVERRMAAQPSPGAWRDAADYVVDNSGRLGVLDTQVALLWDWLSDRGRD